MADEETRPEGEETRGEEAHREGEESRPEGEETRSEGEEDRPESEAARADAEGAQEHQAEDAGAQPDGDSTDEPAGGASAAAEGARRAEPVEAAAGAHDDAHGLSHTMSVQLLVGVFAALTILTILTVAVTAIDLGSQGNFVVAMVIATVKAALVMGVFMHMVWDNKFNVVVFTSSFLFVLLFLTLSLADRAEYQDTIDSWETANASESG